jgi:predicted RNase H-like nuclease (RuvC/YqgF family)
MANDSRHTELRELEALRETVNDQLEHIDSLQGRNDALAAQVGELRDKLREAHDNLVRRDEDLVERETELLTRRSKELKARADEVRWLRDIVEDLQARLAAAEDAARAKALPRLKTRLRRLRS